MDYQSLHMKTVVELRALAKQMGVRIPAGTNKEVLIDMLLVADRRAADAAPKAAKPEAPAPKAAPRRATKPVQAAAPAEKPAAAEKPVATPASEPPKRRGRPPRRASAPAKAEALVNQEKPERKNAAPAKAEAPVNQEKPERKNAAPAKAEAPANQEKPERKNAAPAQPVKPVEAPVPKKAERPAEAAPAAEKPAASPRPGAPMKNAVRGNVAPQFHSVRGRTDANAASPRQGANRGFPVRGVSRPPLPAPEPADAAPPAAEAPQAAPEAPKREIVRTRPETVESKPTNAAEPPVFSEYGEGAGVLDIQPDGYGFLRAENCQQGPNDVYISIAQIRRFGLRNGDYVEGRTRPQREGDRYSAIMYISKVNGEAPELAADRPRFEDLTPIYPDERLRLEPTEPSAKNDYSLRLIDMLAPIGKGQRGMIVSQPKAGKTTLLKKIANAITAKYPDIHLIVLLIDERPEEVTDMQRSIEGEVIYSTFDEMPENHTRVSEMVLDRAQRLVESGKDVVVLLDSITRLARAYNLVIAPTGRSLSGGLDPGALFKPKRFFGAARNIENGGSLTVIATALVETGSRMDDIIFEEFKGTGNMELHLDRKLSDRRVFPAIDMLKSGTRREELLLSEDEMEGELQVRKMLSGGRPQEMAEQLIELLSKTASNAEFFQRLKGWLAVYEKEGYTLGR